MTLTKYLTNGSIDVKSMILGLIVLPVLGTLFILLKKYLSSWATYLLEGLLYHASHFLKSKWAYRLTLRRYCRMKLAEENRYLYVPSSLDIKLEIDQAFVSLTLEASAGDGAIFNHTDIFAVGNRARIVGDPGSGKTSLIKRMMRDACRKALKNPKSARLPVIVELKTLNPPPKSTTKKELGLWFFNKLKLDISQTKAYRMGECFDTYSEKGGLLVLLDGLDEVAAKNYVKVHAAIVGLSERLSAASSNNVIFLTMRSQFHQQVKLEFREAFGPALFVKPFSPSDIYDFLLRWPYLHDKRNTVSRIYQELTDRPSLREMCGNPLVLSMYVAEDQAHVHVVVPNSRTEFYRKVTDELLILRRHQQVGEMRARTKLKEQRERILGRIAYHHLVETTEPANSLSWSHAISVISQELSCDKADAETYFNELAKETGLIGEERVRETFRFIHLTFCEYLAAFEATQGVIGGWKILGAVHKKFVSEARQSAGRLVEIIPFACGLVPRIDREEALSDVNEIGDDNLLARCLLETKLYEHSCWPLFIERRRASLLAVPEDRWDQGWLRDLHLFNVVVRDAEECASQKSKVDGIDLDDFFKALVGKQKESLEKLLSAYAIQDAAAVFRLSEVTRLDLLDGFPDVIVKNCDQAPFFELVLNLAERDSNRKPAWAAVFCEAALRSRFVAAELDRREISNCWGNFQKKNIRNQRWMIRGILPGSLYTQLLSVCTLDPRTIDDRLELVRLLADGPSPADFRLLALAATRGTIVLLLIFVAGMVGLISDLGFGTVLSNTPSALPVILAGIFVFLPSMLFYYLVFRQMAIRFAFRELLNLSDWYLLKQKGPFQTTAPLSVWAVFSSPGPILSVVKVFRNRKLTRALMIMTTARG